MERKIMIKLYTAYRYNIDYIIPYNIEHIK